MAPHHFPVAFLQTSFSDRTALCILGTKLQDAATSNLRRLKADGIGPTRDDACIPALNHFPRIFGGRFQ
jgi:hypothetical protein